MLECQCSWYLEILPFIFQCPVLETNGFGCVYHAFDHVLHDNITVLFDKLKNGNWTAVTAIASIALKPMRVVPELGVVEDATLKYPFVFGSRLDFDFMEIFHIM